jgi:MFS family permease
MSSTALPARAWVIVALLWVCAALNYVDRLILTTMRTSLKEAIPMTEAQFGLLTTAFLIVYAVVSPFAGFLADRVSRSRVITISLLAWSLVTLATAWVTNYEQLLASRILLALAQAACMPASVALIVDYHQGSTRSLASGLLLSGAMTGGALAGLGGWFADRHSWTYAYELFGWIGIGHAVVLAFLLRDRPAVVASPEAGAAPRPAMIDAFRHLFTNRAYLLVLGYACTLGIVGWSVVGWMPTIMKERFAMNQGEAGLTTTICMNVAAFVGMLVGGTWAGRWSRKDPRGPVFVSVIGLALAAPAILLLAHTASLTVALAALALYAAARYFSDANAMPVLCLYVDPRYRATSWGMSTLFSSFIGGLGIYAAGWVRDAKIDLTHLFHFAFGSVLLCAIIMATLSRLPRIKQPD